MSNSDCIASTPASASPTFINTTQHRVPAKGVSFFDSDTDDDKSTLDGDLHESVFLAFEGRQEREFLRHNYGK
jgi:hypothetical protein